MKNVLFHRLARQEFREAVERYAEERRGVSGSDKAQLSGELASP